MFVEFSAFETLIYQHRMTICCKKKKKKEAPVGSWDAPIVTQNDQELAVAHPAEISPKAGVSTA